HELCVVGDDYQSIYAFTGASPDYLIEMTKHHPDAAVVHLVRNYRSSPQVLDLANRLVPSLGGVPKELRPTRPAGPEPITRGFADPAREAAFVVQKARELHRDGTPFEDMAVLYRINSRSEDFEEALAMAGIPFQVRDGAFLSRQAARGLLRRLRGRGPAEAASTVEAA